MSQQINLLNTSLIRARDWLSLRNVAAIYAVIIVVMYWYYASVQAQTEALHQKRNESVAAFEAAQMELQAVSNQASHVSSTKEQELELQSLVQKKEMQGKLLSTFRHVQDDAGHHVLDYMVGFASQPLKDVWITAFKLNAFEQNMSLTGRALQADLVPVFIERLGELPVFKGKLFSGLTLKEVTQSDEVHKVQDETSGAAAANPVKQADVASSDKPEEVRTPLKTSPVRTPLQLIEFDVKGQAGQDQDGMSSTGKTQPVMSQQEPAHG